MPASKKSSGDDDVRARMKEALERKKSEHHDSHGAGPHGDSAAHGAHGPAKQQRQFRRKSGG
jgi:hypothetical protein